MTLAGRESVPHPPGGAERVGWELPPVPRPWACSPRLAPRRGRGVGGPLGHQNSFPGGLSFLRPGGTRNRLQPALTCSAHYSSASSLWEAQDTPFGISAPHPWNPLLLQANGRAEPYPKYGCQKIAKQLGIL